MNTRRSLVAGLVAGGGALWLVRDRLPWPPLEVRFANGRSTPWLPLPPRAELIEIPVVVNGTPIRAIVDSGAQISAIDAKVALSLNLPRTVAAPVLAYGVSGRPVLTHTVRLDLTTDGMSVPNLRAASLDLANLARDAGRDFQMLIGRDVLSQVVLEADFPAGAARFLTPGAFRAPYDAVVVPLRRPGGAPTATMKIDGTHEVEVLIDTGSAGILALTETAARRAGLMTPDRWAGSVPSIGLGGLRMNRQVRARSIGLGPLILRDLNVQVYAPAVPVRSDGLLGTGFLRSYRTVLDLSGERLVLVRPGLALVRRP